MGSDTCAHPHSAAHNSLAAFVARRPRQPRRHHPLSSTRTSADRSRAPHRPRHRARPIVGYDPADPQTAASIGHVPKSYTEFLQPAGLRGARHRAAGEPARHRPADAEVATVVRAAVNR